MIKMFAALLGAMFLCAPAYAGSLTPGDGVIATGENSIGDASGGTPVYPLGLTSGGAITTAITGSTQCLHVNNLGVITGTGADCSLGSGLVVGGTIISGGTSGDIEFNNSGILGELGTTGSGSVVRATAPSVNGLTVTGSFTGTGLITNADLTNDTISGIALGQNLDTLTFGTHLVSGGSSYNGSAGVTITSDATNADTASTIVARDASGNFSAGTITASLTGHASLDCAIAGCTMAGNIAIIGTTLPTQAAGALGLGGIATAPTLTAAGEGDVYLSSTNGLIFQGEGSGNDLELLNKNGSLVCAINSGLNNLSCQQFVVTGNSVPANGIYRPATNTLGFAANTTEVATLTTTAFTLLNSVNLVVGGIPYLSGAPSGSLASYYACFDPSSTPVGEITYQATNCTTSLRDTKHGIEPYLDGLADAMALRPETFAMNQGTDGRRQIGLIAEDVQSTQDMLAGYQDGKLRTVQYDRLGVVAISAIQEIQAEIVVLQHTNDNSIWHRIGVALGLEH